LPFNVNTYVRYWDGHAVGYGKIERVNEDGTYEVRVGGTTRYRTVREGDISIHPVHVASGRKMDTWVMFTRVDVTGRWLYHATAYELLPSIIISRGIVPKSNVQWESLDVGWKGATSNRSGELPKVEMSSYYQTQNNLWKAIPEHPDYALTFENSYRKGLMGDPGEFVYATTQAYIAAKYAVGIHKESKQAIVFRFRSTKAWYEDPGETAVINNMMIVLDQMEVKFLSKRDLNRGQDHVGDNVIANNEGWVPCSTHDRTWVSTIALNARFENFV